MNIQDARDEYSGCNETLLIHKSPPQVSVASNTVHFNLFLYVDWRLAVWRLVCLAWLSVTP